MQIPNTCLLLNLEKHFDLCFVPNIEGSNDYDLLLRCSFKHAYSSVNCAVYNKSRSHSRRFRHTGEGIGLLLSGRGARHDNARYFYRPARLRTIINIAVRLNNKSRHEIAAGSRADRGGWLKVLFFPRFKLVQYGIPPACPARSRGLRSSDLYF